MFGGICGDMVGFPYEFDRSPKIKDFGPLFTEETEYTDDSVMTIAVCEAILDTKDINNDEELLENFKTHLRKWGEMEPYADYGVRFAQWLADESMGPYGSFGNGSAMRVSSVGWLFDSLEQTRRVARLSAEVTHNHPEGIKGAEAVASVIYLARTKNTKEYIKKYVEDNFHYDFSKTLDQIRPDYRHVESCQETVPQAMEAFFEGRYFEDVIRNAVSLGGDCDTLTCIAGSMAEAYYGMPEEIYNEVVERVSPEMYEVIKRFLKVRAKVGKKTLRELITGFLKR